MLRQGKACEIDKGDVAMGCFGQEDGKVYTKEHIASVRSAADIYLWLAGTALRTPKEIVVLYVPTV